MMKFSILLLLLSLPFLVFSQEKALNKAVKKGKNASNLTYLVEFEKYYDDTEVSDWMSKNGYTILQSSTAEYPVFGDTKVGYDQIYFMTNADYVVLKQNLERIAAEERKKNQTVSVEWSDIILAAVAVTTGVIIYKGAEYAIKNGALSNASSGSESGSSKDTDVASTTECSKIYDKKNCGVHSNNQCYIDQWVKNKKVQSKVIIFECLKSKKKYEFYFDNNDSIYRIDAMNVLNKNYDESILSLKKDRCGCE